MTSEWEGCAPGDAFGELRPEGVERQEWSEEVGGSELGAWGEGAEGLGVDGGVEVVVVLSEDVSVVVSGGERPGELEFGWVRRRRRVFQEGVQGVGQLRVWQDREGGRVRER